MYVAQETSQGRLVVLVEPKIVNLNARKLLHNAAEGRHLFLKYAANMRVGDVSQSVLFEYMSECRSSLKMEVLVADKRFTTVARQGSLPARLTLPELSCLPLTRFF